MYLIVFLSKLYHFPKICLFYPVIFICHVLLPLLWTFLDPGTSVEKIQRIDFILKEQNCSIIFTKGGKKKRTPETKEKNHLMNIYVSEVEVIEDNFNGRTERN